MFIAQSKAFRFDGRHTIEFSTNWTIKIDILQQFFGGSGLGLGVRQTISLNGIACIAIDMVSNWWTNENNGSDTIVDNATRAFSIQFSAYRNSVCDNTPFTCFIRWLFVAHSNSTQRTIRLFYAKFSASGTASIYVLRFVRVLRILDGCSTLVGISINKWHLRWHSVYWNCRMRLDRYELFAYFFLLSLNKYFLITKWFIWVWVI